MTENDTDEYGSEMDAYRHGYHDAIEDYDVEVREVVREMRQAVEAGRIKGNDEGANVLESFADDLEELVKDE